MLHGPASVCDLLLCFLLIVCSDIHRAWITVDNKLFLWNYEDG
jgi:hypothetical protein